MQAGRWLLIGLAVGITGGCKKPPPEAPKELGDLGLFLFAHFEDEDPAEMSAGLANLQRMLLDTDMSLDPRDRSVTMPILDGDNLGGLSIPAGALAEDQTPVALPGVSIHPIADQTVLALERNQVCIESATTKWAMRDFLAPEDESCFADGSCDRLEVLQETRKESLADVWYDQYKTYRWFDLEDEQGNVTRAILGRSWTEKVFPADGGSNSWDQLFHLDAFIENPGNPNETLRWFSMWSSVTLLGVGDDLYVSLVVNGISEALTFGDEFISGDIQTCTNDRNAEKPERE